MLKLRELTECERMAVKHLRLLELSFAEIGKQIGSSKSTAFNVFKKFETTGSTEKRKKNCCSQKIQPIVQLQLTCVGSQP